MKKSLFGIALALFVLGAITIQAQSLEQSDYWNNSSDCLSATNAPFYVPGIVRKQALGPNEIVRGIPEGRCVEMDLPDRLNGRGWVRIDADRPFVFDNTTGKLLRLEACNNKVYDSVPFPPVVGEKGDTGEVGPQGPEGQQGPPGQDFTPAPSSRCSVGCKVLIGVGIAAVIVAVASSGSGNSKKNPGGITGGAFGFSPPAQNMGFVIHFGRR